MVLTLPNVVLRPIRSLCHKDIDVHALALPVLFLRGL